MTWSEGFIRLSLLENLNLRARTLRLHDNMGYLANRIGPGGVAMPMPRWSGDTPRVQWQLGNASRKATPRMRTLGGS